MIEGTINLNYLLSLTLPLNMERAFYIDLKYIDSSDFKSLSPQQIENIWNEFSQELTADFLRFRSIGLIDRLTKVDYKNTLEYMFAKTGLERAHLAMSSLDQEMVDKIFNLRMSYCLQVTDLERLLYEWKQENKG